MRKDLSDLLSGAANEQQRHGGQDAEEDGRGAEFTGSAHRETQPPHQDAAEHGPQHRQRDADSA